MTRRMQPLRAMMESQPPQERQTPSISPSLLELEMGKLGRELQRGDQGPEFSQTKASLGGWRMKRGWA